MSFNLKKKLQKAGVTYQRAATILLHDMMHKTVKVYVDNMIVKSRGRDEHCAVLRRFFDRIRQYQLRLNPPKCAFGVTSGKLSGFIVSQRGKEVDPEKVRAPQEITPPRNLKELKYLRGRNFNNIYDGSFPIFQEDANRSPG